MRDRFNHAIIVDLDSTLANTEHRLPLAQQVVEGHATWDTHSLACDRDALVPGVAKLMEILWPSYEIHIVSNRRPVAEEKTVAWLKKHGVRYDYLALGQDKISYIRRLREEARKPVDLLLDDWPDSAAHISKVTGVPVVLVNPGYAGSEHNPWGKTA